MNKIQLAGLLFLSTLSLKWTYNTGLPVSPQRNVFINYSGITFNYTKLKLTKEKYNQLKSNVDERQKKNGLVFQFIYLSQTYPYPTLKAYPRTIKDKDVTFGSPLNLEYFTSRPLPDLSACDEQVTGDLQITFYDMEVLKSESNPANAEAYQYFLFTPKYDSSTQHIYFEMKVFPSTNPSVIPKSKDVKPSPPY